MTTLKEKLQEVKSRRIEAEEQVYLEAIKKFLNFNVNEALIENRERAEKSLKKDKIIASIGLSTVGALGYFMVGACVANPLSAVVIAPIAVFGTGLLLETEENGKGFISLVTKLFKNTDQENNSMIKNQIKELEKNIDNNKVKTKTTMKDYFNASKLLIKEKFSETKINIQKQISGDDAKIYYNYVLNNISRIRGNNDNNNDNKIEKKFGLK